MTHLYDIFGTISIIGIGVFGILFLDSDSPGDLSHIIAIPYGIITVLSFICCIVFGYLNM